MTFPVREAVAETAVSTAGTSHAINLPAFTGGDPNNDIGQHIVIFTAKGSGVATFNTLADWTELVDENVANGLTVWVHAIDGTEGSTVTFTSSANTRSASIAYRVSGMAALGTQLPELSTVATGSSTNPNATTCTPTGGAKDYLWFTFFARSGEEADDDTWVTGTPTNFTNLLQKACGTAGTNLGGMIAVAEQALNAASLDAAAFTCATGGWRAYTLAVHPNQQLALAANCDSVSDVLADLFVDSPGPDVLNTRSSQDTTGVTNHTVTLPDGSNVTGRRVVVWFAAESTVSWPGGWTELVEGSTTSTVLAVAERIIDGTEGFDGVDDAITVTTGAASQSNAHAYLISGSHASTPSEAATAATGSGANADPPSVNPTGWDVEQTLVIAGAAYRFNASFSAAPANYEGLMSSSGGDDNAPLGTAHRVVSAASEDPGAFTSGDGANWVATTVAIRPESVAGPISLEATLDAVSDQTALLGLDLPLAATSDAVSNQTALLGLLLPLAATSDSVSDQQATASLALGLTATSDLVSDQTADLTVVQAGLEAVLDAVSDIQASLGLALPLAGTVDSVSSQTALLGLALPLATSLDSVSDQTAALRLSLSLAATLDTVSDMTGDLSVQGQTLEGFVNSVSDVQASLGLQLPLATNLDSVSDQLATLRLAQALAASVDSVSSQEATLGLQVVLAAQLDLVSDQLATLDVFLPGLLQVAFGKLSRRYGSKVLVRRYSAQVVTRRYRSGELRREP